MFVSFQSTGATHISSVNNLPSCQLYVGKKERGRKEEKNVWGIEQNEARETYLSYYYGINIADHMIQNTNIKFISWKWWCMAYLHALSLGVLAAYDMYNEYCDGDLSSKWKTEPKHRMSFAVFRQTLSQQMLEYNPSNLKYLGDEKNRMVTQSHKKRQSSIGGKRQERKRGDEIFYKEEGMTVDNFAQAMDLPWVSHEGSVNRLKEHMQYYQENEQDDM